MAKKEDENGYWLIEGNPISKGDVVLQYYGRDVSPELPPDELVNVFRPLSEISTDEAVKSFDAIPLIDDHEFLGKNGTKYDSRAAAGVVFNPRIKDGYLIADLKIFSESLQEKIKSGKRELSPCYNCRYTLESGEHEGTPYSAVQRGIKAANHVALVERGRTGSDVRIYDGAQYKRAMDSMPITKEIVKMPEKTSEKTGSDAFIDTPKFVEFVGGLNLDEATKKKLVDFAEKSNAAYKRAEDEDVDKRKLIDEIGGILKGKVDEEVWRTVIGKAEKLSYNDSSRGTANDEEEEGGKDKQGDGGEKKESPAKDDGDGKKDEAKEKTFTASDAAEMEARITKSIMKAAAKKSELVGRLEEHIGVFDSAEMTLEDVALYGCKKLGVEANASNAVAVVNAVLQARENAPSQGGLYAFDAFPAAEQGTAFDKYMKEGEQ